MFEHSNDQPYKEKNGYYKMNADHAGPWTYGIMNVLFIAVRIIESSSINMRCLLQWFVLVIMSTVLVESLFLKKGSPRRNQRPVTTIEMHVKKLNSQKRYVIQSYRQTLF